ncbi:hypothetical protein BBP40_011259 [Aspergillus hancockii]|nr:hypothetical protein BBP40_011259 [Aspergillus hancockii]
MHPKICEINALAEVMRNLEGLESVSDPKYMVDSLFTLFDPKLPIHFIRGEDRLSSTEVFDNLVEQRFGMRPKAIKPSDLRVLPDVDSKTGYSLFCLCEKQVPGLTTRQENGDTLEQIHQAGLQLFHHDYRTIAPDVLQHLAINGVNDLRTVFLLNDKRILGIIHQELETLVNEHHVLTKDQAEILRRGIVPTILPGSQELKELINQSRKGIVKKDDFIIKPCRGSRGAGHLLGEQLSLEEWDSLLVGMQDTTLQPDRTQYIVQPFIEQPVFSQVMEINKEECRNRQALERSPPLQVEGHTHCPVLLLYNRMNVNMIPHSQPMAMAHQDDHLSFECLNVMGPVT